jgi:hypothetical protein
MQLFFDKEADGEMEIEIQNHLKNCEVCSSLYKEVVDDKVLINRILDIAESVGETGLIPPFKRPINKRMKSASLRLIVILVAASVIGLIFLSPFYRQQGMEENPSAEMLYNEFYEGKDLNKLWHDKSQIIIIQDENGNVIQSLVTY